MRALLVLALAVGAAPAVAADYVVIRHELAVARPADAVWARVGDYCAIRDWLKVSCSYASGTGALGTVRSLREGATIEPMVAQGPRSYTYAQTVGNMAGKEYHGTLAVEPDGARRSRIIYQLVYDQEKLAPETRVSERERITKRFGEAVATMKAMAEK
jgi:hypothetical protein